MSNLKGCPFCGTLPESPMFSRSAVLPKEGGHFTLKKDGILGVHPENIGYSLMCPNLDCGMEGPIGTSEEEAVARWNDRR